MEKAAGSKDGASAESHASKELGQLGRTLGKQRTGAQEYSS